jgi:hypothetical protein
VRRVFRFLIPDIVRVQRRLAKQFIGRLTT